jgi:hypothetical protein
MNPKSAIYWGATVLFCLALGAGGAADLALTEDMAQAMDHLGYPAYFARILGAWKLLGVVALLAPGFGRLKEWAYAGFVFNLTGAAASHLFVGDGVGGALPPAVLLTLLAASWALAPASRRLGERVQLPGAALQPQAQR